MSLKHRSQRDEFEEDREDEEEQEQRKRSKRGKKRSETDDDEEGDTDERSIDDDEEDEDRSEEEEENRDEEEIEDRKTPKKRHISVKWGTGTGVLRQDEHGEFLEILDLKGADLSRLSSGDAPFLAGHSQELKDVLGRVVDAYVKNGEGYATIAMSQNPNHRNVLQDVLDGMLRSISVGYTVLEAKEIEPDANGMRRKLVTKFLPLELSLVSVPADGNCRVESVSRKYTAPAVFRALDFGPLLNANKTKPTLNRTQEIIRITRKLKLSSEFQIRLIESGCSVQKARDLAAEEFVRQGGKQVHRPSVTMQRDETDTLHRSIESAILHRLDRSKYPLQMNASQFADKKLLDMEAVLIRRSNSYFQTRNVGAQTSSAFPELLGNALNRRLRDVYTEAPATWRPFTKEQTVPDFREQTLIQFADSPFPEQVQEGAQLRQYALGESADKFQVKQWGYQYQLTRPALINDDLGAFSRISQSAISACMSFISVSIWNEIAKNNGGMGATMGDGKSLFHADHHNMSTNPGPISIDSLSEARRHMRRQKNLAGRPIDLLPKYLVVSTKHETTAQQFLSSSIAGQAIMATLQQQINPFINSLNLIAEVRLEDVDPDAWYLIADPSQIDCVQLSWLAESGIGPRVQVYPNESLVGGLRFEVMLEMVPKVVDYRAFYRNAGKEIASASTSSDIKKGK